MTQELVVADPQQPAFMRGNQLAPSANVGAVAIEQERAIAEAQGQLILAKKFPRDENTAFSKLMRSCKSKAFAEVAFYAVPNRGSGPSIRFAEEVARVYGNFQYGHRELSRDGNKSEIEVFAWDMEENNRSIRQITVFHVTDTKGGPKPLRDQAEIDNKIANVASKQVRGRILALLPKWFVQEAIEECRKTLAGNTDEPMDVRIRKMTQAFEKYGVTVSHLERYLGHKLDQTLIDELVDLRGVINAIKEGTPASEFFGAEQQAENNEKTAAAITEAAKAGAATEPAATKPTRQPRAAAKPAEAKVEPAQQQAQAEPEQPTAGSPQAEPDRKEEEKVSNSTEEQTVVPAEAQDEPAADSSGGPDDVF